MLIDSGLQNDTVLVVDERIYRLCVQVCIPIKLKLFFIVSLSRREESSKHKLSDCLLDCVSAPH
jgi:hypothetical protein